MKSFAKTPDMVKKLEDFQKRFRGDFELFRGRAESILRKNLDEDNQGSVGDRESNMRRAVTLAKTLYDEEAFETITALFQLVKILEDTEDTQKIAERLNILSDLVDAIEKEKIESESPLLHQTQEEPQSHGPVEAVPDKAQDGGNREDRKTQLADLNNEIEEYLKEDRHWREGYWESADQEKTDDDDAQSF
jgi:hypothetical protein